MQTLLEIIFLFIYLRGKDRQLSFADAFPNALSRLGQAKFGSWKLNLGLPHAW